MLGNKKGLKGRDEADDVMSVLFIDWKGKE